MGELERVASVFLGSLLLTKGIRKLSLSGAAAAFVGYRLINRGVTGQCNLYKVLNVSTRRPDEGIISSKTFSHPLHQHIRVEESVTIQRPVEEVFSFWRKLENLPRFMDHLESVEVRDEKRSHWKAKAPRGQSVEWDATIIAEEPNKKIAWKSDENASVPNSGQVLFSPTADGRGTDVKVLIAYDPPAGILGALYSKLFREDPGTQVREDLGNARKLLESEGAPAA
ncbi:MAG: SRPBCC family protein [Phycisphaerae bacterium]